jgi:adenylate cyclase
VQDEIVRAIVTEMQVKLVDGAQARTWRRSTSNSLAYDWFLRGEYARRQHLTRQNLELVKYCARKAIEYDPNFPNAYTLLAGVTRLGLWAGVSHDIEMDLEQIYRSVARAMELDPELPSAIAQSGFTELMKKNFDSGLELLERAMRKDPEAANIVGAYATGLNMAGLHRQGLEVINNAIHLTPVPPAWMELIIGLVLFHLDRFDEAIGSLRSACASGYGRNPYLHLVAAYSALGMAPEGESALSELRQLGVDASLAALLRVRPYRLAEDRERLAKWLAKAGVTS